MTETVSALEGRIRSGHFGAAGSSGISVSEIQSFTLTQFTAWADAMPQAGTDIAHRAGCSAPAAPGLSTEGIAGRLLRVEPLRWWLVGNEPFAPSGDAAGRTHTVVDLSHSRVLLRLSGQSTAELLNHYLPLDLRNAHFQQGHVACSAIHHVGVTLWRDAAGFNLLIPRSFAVSVWSLLVESAKQFGVETVPWKYHSGP